MRERVVASTRRSGSLPGGFFIKKKSKVRYIKATIDDILAHVLLATIGGHHWPIIEVLVKSLSLIHFHLSVLVEKKAIDQVPGLIFYKEGRE